MIYAKKKSEFLQDVKDENIEEFIHDLNVALNRTSGENSGEENAWRSSVCGAMNEVLSSGEISDNIGVAVEFQIPSFLNRVDMILSGKNDKGKTVIVIIELKQWSEDSVRLEKQGVYYSNGAGYNYSRYPVEQAYGYKKMLQWGIPDEKRRNLEIHCIAYLHNYKKPRDNSDGIFLSDTEDPNLKKARDETELFFEGQGEALAEHIGKLLPHGDNGKGLKFIEDNFTGYSRSLQRDLNAAMDNYELSGAQSELFEMIQDAVDEAYETETQKVLIIEGDAGTGKSVVALYSVIKISEIYNGCFYVSKNSAPRKAFADRLGGAVDFVCKVSDDFIINKISEYSTLTVVDEAHRLLAESCWNNKSKKSPNPQFRDIIDDSLVSVFFIDPKQIVTDRDAGMIDKIKAYCGKDENKIPCKHIKLTSQFRCNGSDAYIRWVDNLVDNKNDPIGKLDYDVDVCDSFDSFYQQMCELNGGEDNHQDVRARMVAGYCWKWQSSHSDTIDFSFPAEYQLKWNKKPTSNYLWATDPYSFKDIGSIHSCQGLEFDYVGVIIGPDLRVINGKIKTFRDKRAPDDFSITGRCYDKLADTIIRNTYRVLLTRGMKGCRIFCANKKDGTCNE